MNQSSCSSKSRMGTGFQGLQNNRHRQEVDIQEYKCLRWTYTNLPDYNLAASNESQRDILRTWKALGQCREQFPGEDWWYKLSAQFRNRSVECTENLLLSSNYSSNFLDLGIHNWQAALPEESSTMYREYNPGSLPMGSHRKLSGFHNFQNCSYTNRHYRTSNGSYQDKLLPLRV